MEGSAGSPVPLPAGGSVKLERPVLMVLAGRSGMAYFGVLTTLIVVAAVLVTGQLPPAWVVGVIFGWMVFDCAGGVRVTPDSIRFRSYFRIVEVPMSSVEGVNVYRSVGVWGTCPVVALLVRGGAKIRIRPMATLSMTQARESARFLAAVIDVAPPPKNWDGS